MGFSSARYSLLNLIDAADSVIGFIEKHCSHVKGELGGKPFLLEQWQKEQIIKPLYGTLNAEGLRQYRTAYIELPRKNGKSNLAACLALYHLLKDGEHGAEVISAAGDRNQARIVFECAAAMVRQSEVLSKHVKIKQNSLEYKNNWYRAISAEANTKHGFSASAVIFDELHTQPNRDLWDVLTTSTGARRQPLVVAITTAGHDVNSICYEVHDYAKRVQKKEIDDPTFLPVIYAADKKDDWREEATWRKANPGYGTICKAAYFQQEVRKCESNPRQLNTFLRLHLNIWTSSETSWLTDEEFMRGADSVPEEKLKRLKCYAGLDLASVKDLTAVALIWRDDEEDCYYLRAHHFCNSVKAQSKEKSGSIDYFAFQTAGLVTITEGNVTDMDAVRDFILSAHQQYDLQALAFDRYYAEMVVPDLIAAGIDCQKFGQGYASMSYPTKELERLMCQGKIIHGAHPVLRWQIGCVQLQRDDADNIKVSKRKNSESQKVDGIVASIMALGCYFNNADDEAVVLQIVSL